MNASRLALASLASGLLFPLALLALADPLYLVNPWESAPNLIAFFLFSPAVAVVCGHLASFKSRQAHCGHIANPAAIAGLALGYAGLAFIVIFPMVNRPRPHFEAAAVGALRSVNAAAHGFSREHHRFPAALSELACAHDDQKFDWCLDPVLAGGTKGPYRISYALQKSSGPVPSENFEIHADPTKLTPFTRYHFFVDQTGLVRYELDHIAGSTSRALQ